MEVQWDFAEDMAYINYPIGNQTFHMGFGVVEESIDTVYINIELSVYNKRKHQIINEAMIKSTGLKPWSTFFLAKKAFTLLENECRQHYGRSHNVFIYCTWLDNRRREVYEKFLTHYGYRYGTSPYGEKCLFKKYKKGEV